MLRRKFTARKAYNKKGIFFKKRKIDLTQINNLTLLFRELEKDQATPKASRRKEIKIISRDKHKKNTETTKNQ